MNIDEVLRPVRSKSLLRVPKLVRQALGLTWAAAPRQLATSGALQFAAGIGLAGQLLLGRELVSRLTVNREDFDVAGAIPVLAGLALVTAAVSFAALARIEQQRLLTELVARHATSQVLEVATSVHLLAFDDPRFHDRLERARLNSVVRPAQMANGVLGLSSSLFAIVGIGVALFILQPVFLLFVVLAYAPLWLVTLRASRAAYEFTVEQTSRDRMRAYLFQVLSERASAAEVRSFELDGYLRTRHDALFADKIADLRTLVRRRLRLALVGSLGTAALTAVAVGVLVALITAGSMTLAEAAAAAVGLLLLGSRLQMLAGSAGSIYESSLFIEDFTDFVGALPRLRASKPTGTPPPDWSVLRAADVCFQYPTRDEPSLLDVSVELHRGEVIALVGENGSGKTTLAKLMAGLYEPTRGSVLLDDTDMAGCDPQQVRGQVAVVLQDFLRYQLSVTDNIGLGRAARLPDPEGVRDAARRADADDFLARLPRGYDSWLGSEYFGGSDLSGGQWQRVALARAFFRDAPILILDEPSAALDARAEAALFQRVRDLYADRSVVLISHRFATVRLADRIYVLHGGRVVETGSHDDLVALGGRYAELFAIQAAAYQRVAL